MLLQISSFDTFLYSQSALSIVLIFAIIAIWKRYTTEKDNDEVVKDKLRTQIVLAKDEGYSKILEVTKSAIQAQHETINIVKDMMDSMRASMSGQQQAFNDSLDKKAEIVIARLSEKLSNLERLMIEHKK